jgi:hypothetical protein
MKKTPVLSIVMIVAVIVIGMPAAYAQHGHGGGMPAGVGHGNSGMNSHAPSSPSSTTPHTGKDNSSVSTRLSSNTKLASKLQGLLPPGTDLQQAAQGFKNLGQFVAAVHVSHNLGIPFDQLKAKMTGTGAESLGKAIHDLKPSADAKTEAKKAGKEADNDLDDKTS